MHSRTYFFTGFRDVVFVMFRRVEAHFCFSMGTRKKNQVIQQNERLPVAKRMFG